MNTLNKLLKQHAKIYSPHNQVLESLNVDSRQYLVLFLLVIELGSMEYFFIKNQLLVSFFLFVTYLLTVGIAAFFHFKSIKELYGSVEALDGIRMDNFVNLVLQTCKINLLNNEENVLIDTMVREKLEKNNRNVQSKKNLYLAILTTSLPFIIQYVVGNGSTTILSLFITAIGFLLLIFSLQSTFKDYTFSSKLEHLSELLKELRVKELIEQRVSEQHLENN